VLLDGELVCFDHEGLPDFERLRSRLRARAGGAVTARATAPATLIVFDVLHLAGRSTRPLPYRERRALLESLALEGPSWRTPRAFAVDEDLVAVTRDRHLEGVVAKRLSAPYQARRRSEAWRKHKHRHRERLTITAWRPGDRREPDELLLSRRGHGGQLRYAGGVRFGLSTTERARLRAVLERLERPRAARSRVRRVQPVVAVDVDYHGRPGGPLRDAVLRNVAVTDELPASHT
jgi:bifunctional non-homologous end joining protein LigD